ncbi:MAG: hypothetical protein HRT38_01120 [Alteromonadaceae bacterium]|nr:hypothetical protein [Alteromonadaceae bacterium]
MSIANPLTASSDIQRITPSTILIPSDPNPYKPNPYKPELGEFSDDILEISKIGLKKQKNETQLEAAKEIEQIANDVVKISSTIGKARSQGNLTAEQALALYNKIANLL